ncbi:hypothetical protein ACI2JA_15045 [Alkalihalobacillus sp. NPDC078783]
MAFGIKRPQLNQWKQAARSGEIAFLTHYWLDDRFPDCTTVTKVACCDVDRLIEWGIKYGLKKEWIHVRDEFPHFDLFGQWQEQILRQEGQLDQLTKLQRK